MEGVLPAQKAAITGHVCHGRNACIRVVLEMLHCHALSTIQLFSLHKRLARVLIPNAIHTERLAS